MSMAILSDARPVGEAVEDYAKAIFHLERCEGEAKAVMTNDLARRLQVTPASASAMVKKLHGLGLASHEPYHGVRLTDAGVSVALEVLRHHRLLELYLAEELGLPWDRVHAEAEVLEHALSEELEAHIAAKLGDPQRDPHGDPIPSRDLRLDETATVSLDECAAGTEGTFVRVSDADPAMLRYLAERGIRPGQHFRIVDKQPFGGPTFVRFTPGDEVHPLGGDLARAMRVTAGPA